MHLTWIAFLIATLVLGVGAALQGAVGYGLGLLASPVLVLIEPRMIPGPFMLAALALTISMTLRERQALDPRGVGWMVAGLFPGALLGVLVLTRLPQRTFSIVFGVAILLAVLMSASGLRLPTRKSVLGAAGFIGGVMSILAGMSGPPAALALQDEPPQRLRAMLSVFFIANSLISIAVLIPAGRFGVYEMELAAVQLPGILLGFLVSSHLVKHLGGRSLRPAILGLSALTAVVVILKQVL
jgi:uncharacterized membrane protein YfcA